MPVGVAVDAQHPVEAGAGCCAATSCKDFARAGAAAPALGVEAWPSPRRTAARTGRRSGRRRRAGRGGRPGAWRSRPKNSERYCASSSTCCASASLSCWSRPAIGSPSAPRALSTPASRAFKDLALAAGGLELGAEPVELGRGDLLGLRQRLLQTVHPFLRRGEPVGCGLTAAALLVPGISSGWRPRGAPAQCLAAAGTRLALPFSSRSQGASSARAPPPAPSRPAWPPRGGARAGLGGRELRGRPAGRRAPPPAHLSGPRSRCAPAAAAARCRCALARPPDRSSALPPARR